MRCITGKVTTSGAQAWTVVCRFRYRARGWNTSWRAARQQWEPVCHKTFGGGAPAPYNNFPIADFSQVLA